MKRETDCAAQSCRQAFPTPKALHDAAQGRQAAKPHPGVTKRTNTPTHREEGASSSGDSDECPDEGAGGAGVDPGFG